jgi:hypothetical protein
MTEVILSAAFALGEAQKEEHYVWPIRFTAVLVRQGAQWKFHQIHFSFLPCTPRKYAARNDQRKT